MDEYGVKYIKKKLKKNYEKMNIYHAQKSFSMEEDFNPLKFS